MGTWIGVVAVGRRHTYFLQRGRSPSLTCFGGIVSSRFFGPGPLDSGEIYAVTGTLGTETGNATYVGLGVNQASRLNGVAHLSDEDAEG